MAQEREHPTRGEWLESSNANPDDIVTGDDPMTDDQAHRLKALCWRLGERFDRDLTVDQARSRIAELEARS